MRTIMPDRSLHFLLPFALPPADVAPHLPASDHPALDRLVARARVEARRTGDDFQRTLPHERWLARQFGASDPAETDAAPLAPYMLGADGGEPGDATWACVQPVHVQIARDHLVLIDPASLELADDDAAQLLAVARPLIEELDVALQAPHPARWYLSSPRLATLAGAAPLRASGRNIEIWLPHEATTGERSRLWMKLQNEVQMAWFQHPVNEAREARGLPSVNSIWFHAQGARRPVASPFAQVLSAAPATLGLARAAGAPYAAPPAGFDALPAPSGATLVELDTLTRPYIEQDWAQWHAALTALERDWFAPALAALTAGRLDVLAFTLGGDVGDLTLRVTRGDLRKFWRRRAFTSLFESDSAA